MIINKLQISHKQFPPTIVGTEVIHEGKGICRAKINFLGDLEQFKNEDGSINEDKITSKFKELFHQEDRGCISIKNIKSQAFSFHSVMA